MTNAESATPLGTWRVPQCPFLIEYDHAIMASIHREVMEGFRALPHGGLEVGGLLLGIFAGDRMRITGFERIPCEHAHGPSFRLSETDRIAMIERLDHYAATADEDGERVLGWYHSHTRSGLAFSPDDLTVHYKLFPEPWHVALLLRPNGNGVARAGFFFRDPGSSAIRTSASYEEFTIEAAPTTVPPRSSPATRRMAVEDRSAAASPVSLSVVAEPEVESADRPAEKRSKISWGTLAAMAILLVGAVAAVPYVRTYFSPKSSPAPQAGFLRVETVTRGSNLEITWDTRNLGQIKQGQLDIEDGPIRAKLLLDRSTLAAGAVSYAYKSDVTGFRLRVEREDGTALEGSTTYIAPKSNEPAAKPEEPPATGKAVATSKSVIPEPELKPALETAATPAPKSKVLEPRKPAPDPPAVPLSSRSAALQLEGRWVLSPDSAERSHHKPQSVVVHVTEANGSFQGTLAARYKSSKPQSFSFGGKMVNGRARFPWAGKNDQHGEIEFIQVPNTIDSVEVVWYGADKQVFDHIVRKVN